MSESADEYRTEMQNRDSNTGTCPWRRKGLRTTACLNSYRSCSRHRHKHKTHTTMCRNVNQSQSKCASFSDVSSKSSSCFIRRTTLSTHHHRQRAGHDYHQPVRPLASTANSFLHHLFALVALACIFAPTAVHAQDRITLGPIKEGLEPSSYVGSVATAAGIANMVNAAEFKHLNFKILDDRKPAAQPFSMNGKSGAIFIRRKINRETICANEPECILEFDVTVTSDVSSFLRIITVKVNVTDINDNAPTFDTPEITLNIPENEAGITRRLPLAKDSDIGDNTIKNYYLLDGQDPFSIEARKLMDGSWIVDLVVNSALDREKVDFYTLQVAAVDGGQQPFTGTLTVKINVTDKNDESPEFTRDRYAFRVKETARTGQVVSKLTATDKDTGKNADIKYIMKFNDKRGDELFSIDQFTGEITIQAPLQYDARKTFHALVEAWDKGDQPNFAEAQMTLTVDNVGNNPPQIDLKLETTRFSESVSISEDAVNSTFVGKLTPLDSDPGPAGQVSCRSLHNQFKLNNVGDYYTIIMNSTLDREQESAIDVTLVCSDNGSPPLSSYKTFNVIVLDVNDSPPRFNQSIYTVDVEEENIIGKRIFKMNAIDPDYTNNNVFKYELFPQENSVFSIDEDTGIIKARTTFDHELEKSINVIVRAVDFNDPSLSSSATVIVNIVDINDNYPEITVKELRVPEGGGRMKVVGIIRGEDKDSGLNAQLLFSMPSGGADSTIGQKFRVDPDGTVVAIQELDRETKDNYELDIEVRDSGDPPKYNRGTVKIIVEDINDNQPVFTYPSQRDQSVTVLWSTPPGRELVRLNATDDDLGENRTITYLIYSGNGAGLFSLDPDTGSISLRRYIREEDARLYKLMVAAKDGGAQPQEKIMFLEFVIDVVNATFDINLRMDEFLRETDHEIKKAKEERYILIAGIVAGITLFLSIIIIVVIILIRKGGSDARRRRRQQVQVPLGDKQPQWEVVKIGVQEEGGKNGGEVEKVAAWRGSDADLDMKGDGSGGAGSDRSSFGQPDVTKTGNDSTLKKTVASSHWYDGKDSATAGQSTSNIGIGLDPYRKQDFYTFCKVRQPPHGDDVHSVTSGETATSDSGRGGSEDDIPLPPIAECSPELNSNHSSPKHMVEYRPIVTSPVSSLARSPYGGKSEFRTMPTLSSFRGGGASDSIKMYPVSTTSTRPQHSGDSTPTGVFSQSPYRTLPSAFSDKANPKPSSQEFSSFSPVSAGGSLPAKTIGSQGRHVTFSPSQPSMRSAAVQNQPLPSMALFSDPNRRGSPFTPISAASIEGIVGGGGSGGGPYSSSGRPRSIDDDDGNTTTSGSYTIDSDHLNDLNDSIISA